MEFALKAAATIVAAYDFHAQSGRRSGALRCVAVALCLLGGASAALGQGGMSLPGKLGVSTTGASTYGIPIAVPPGTAGMAPSLSLEYSSQGGNGIVGMGWSLAGLPTITRCPRTPRQDGAFGTIKFDGTDRFCLDGQRLVAVEGGAYGADGTRYRTEVDSYALIVSHGNSSGAPLWFEVRTKSGQVMQFGATPDSLVYAYGTTVPRAWAVNRVSDVMGNYFSVGYINSATQAFPDHIYYTANDVQGLPINNVIFFFYEGRPDPTQSYRGGILSQTSVRLTAINTYSFGALVSNYRLAYQQSLATQRSRLASVQVCGTGLCLPATTFAWQDVSQQFAAPSLWVAFFGGDPERGAMPSNAAFPRFVTDVNGDGLPDIVGFGQNDVSVSLNTGSSFSGPQAWLHCAFTVGCGLWPDDTAVQPTCGGFVKTPMCGAPLSNRPHPRYVLDMNGDGLPDILGFGPAGIAVAINTGSGFDGPNTWLSCAQAGLGRADCFPALPTDEDVNPRYIADMNGDGLPDLVSFTNNFVVVTLNNRTGFLPPQFWLGCELTFDCGGWKNSIYPRHLADVNGDGLPDIVGFGENQVYVSLNTGSGFLPSQSWLACSYSRGCGSWPSNADAYPRYLIDMNGDGLADIVAISQNAVHVSLSTGTGFTGPQAWITCSFTLDCGGWPNDSQYPRYFSDVNGDGLPDLVGFGGNAIYVSLNTGSNFSGAPIWLDNAFTIAGGGWTDNDHFPRYLVDVNGDGRADIVGFGTEGVSVSTAAGSLMPDLLASVTTGLGATTSVTYHTLADPAFYPRDGGFRLVPRVDVTGALQVVSRVDNPNGVGGTYAMTYRYLGARADIAGHGFLGFRQMSMTDVQTGIVTTTAFNQEFPFIGLVDSVTKTLAAATLNYTANTYELRNGANGSVVSGPTGGLAPYRVWLTQTFDASADLDGSPMPALTTTYQYDEHGNPTSIIAATSDGASKTTVNTYSNDPVRWILGRLTRATVTSSQP